MQFLQYNSFRANSYRTAINKIFINLFKWVDIVNKYEVYKRLTCHDSNKTKLINTYLEQKNLKTVVLIGSGYLCIFIFDFMYL